MASSTVNGGGSHRGAPSCAYQTPKWILNYLNRCRRQLPKGSPEWQEYPGYPHPVAAGSCNSWASNRVAQSLPASLGIRGGSYDRRSASAKV